MKSIIIIEKSVANKIIKHAYTDPENECGGYLFGKMIIRDDTEHFYISEAYYEKNIKGSSADFIFPLLYEARARNWGNERGLSIIGSYHSHGQYPTTLSETDINVLGKHWSSNKILMTFSPGFFDMYAETFLKGGTRLKNQIFIKSGKRYNLFVREYNEQIKDVEKSHTSQKINGTGNEKKSY